LPTKIFLSGAIEGVEEYGVEWRKVATKSLHLLGYDVLDPTSLLDTDYETPEEIVEKNLYLQKRSDILLVEYMIQDRQYIGTDFEMAWAKLHGQPIVVFASPQAQRRVYLKYMATKLASSMQDAIEYIASNYPSK
jgi:nucleoside 2-deoxyribosyltransferase